MNWKDVANLLSDKMSKTAERSYGISGADAVTSAVAGFSGASLGGLIGWKVAENRKKDRLKAMLIGSILGGVGSSAAASYAPLLFR